jgi:hypothetical protein
MHKIIYLLISLVFGFNAIGEEGFNYQLRGSYKLESSKKRPVEFTLQWKEEKDKITGEYSDNFFIDKAEVTGAHGDLGRNFVVKLPSEKNGVKSITLLSSEVKGDKTGTTVPVSIVTRDIKGNPLTTTEGNSNFVTLYSDAQKQEDNTCEDGFGALAGYCGVYEGMIAEDKDRRNKCNLLFTSAVRLELTNDQTLILHMGQVSELVDNPRHEIGRLPISPENRLIDVMSRACRPLQGINAPGDSCKQLNLVGKFTTRGTNKHFTGTYTIKQEGTNNFCQYTLSMDLPD